MAPKKKASRDSSATAGSKTKAKWQPTVPSGAPILPRRKGGRAIACRVRGITWGALDFTVVVDAEQPLFDVVERIVAQHGGAVHADTLVLYRGDPPLSAPLSAELVNPSRLPPKITRGPQRISSRCCHPHAENME
uniref:Uncharacterized protein n=1 Tax=Emiliania huxleyi TaxID=2903 RepID=A0A7S3W192_EMIHU|mmetsp:Transcript_5938/g.17221  ORF Transcript_5938/g.17221 Transcript_5938/m.17221 type:complete len:135 (+) Transcript_5938:39-443(+)